MATPSGTKPSPSAATSEAAGTFASSTRPGSEGRHEAPGHPPGSRRPRLWRRHRERSPRHPRPPPRPQVPSPHRRGPAAKGGMKPRAIHQVLAALAYGDAIGNEALAIRGHLRGRGYESDIFAEKVHPQMAGLARPLSEYAGASGLDTLCMFHFSIGSAASSLVYHR